MRTTGPKVNGPYKHGSVWRVHLTTGSGRGGRTTTYQIFADRAEAEAFAAGARDEAQGCTVTQAITAFLDRKRELGRAASTIESAEDRLEMILSGLKSRSVKSLTGRGDELYALARKGRAADTHRNALSVAKDFGAFCVKRKWLRANPFDLVEPVGAKVLGADKPQLRVDESRKLRTWCHMHILEDKGALLTLAYLLLGARASELVKRDVRDLDDGGTLLWIGVTKSKKGRRRLAIPGELVPPLLELVRNRPSDAPLFVHDSGERWSRFVARDHVRRVCKAAGVPVLPPQALRRTQSTLATEAGVAAQVVADHLGHESPAITAQAYVQRDAARAAQGERALRVIAGGRR